MKDPVFVISAARSGSTLLSALVGIHPQFINAGETNFNQVLTSIHNAQIMTHRISGNDLSSEFADPGLKNLDELRTLGEAFYRESIDFGEAIRICDKSLPNVFGCRLLEQVWPNSKFIAVHRHVADFAHSALASTPWGLSGYGFDEYATGSPSNAVLGLVRYWIDRVQGIRAYAADQPNKCLPIRYEDLVEDAEGQLDRIWNFLEVAPLTDNIRTLFPARRRLRTPCDHKILHTTTIHDESIGRGLRIPLPRLVPEHILSATNEELRRLGYYEVDQEWGLLREDLSAGDRISLTLRSLPKSWPRKQRRPTKSGNREPRSIGAANGRSETTDTGTAADSDSNVDRLEVELVVTNGRYIEDRKTIDVGLLLAEDRPSGSDPPSESRSTVAGTAGVLIVSAETLLSIASGYIDFGEAFRRGDVRYYANSLESGARRVDEGEPIVESVGRVIIDAAHSLFAGTGLGSPV